MSKEGNNLSAEAKPFIPGGGSGGGSSSGPSGPPPAQRFMPPGPRSPAQMHPSGGGGHGGDMPNLGGQPAVPMAPRGNYNNGGGGGPGQWSAGGNSGRGHPFPNNQGGGGFTHHGPSGGGMNNSGNWGGNRGGPNFNGGGGGPNMPQHPPGPSFQGGGHGHGGNMGSGGGHHMGGGHGHGPHGGGMGGGNMGHGPGPGHHGGGGQMGGGHMGGGLGQMGGGMPMRQQAPPQKPLFILMLGGMSTGKSSLGQKLAEKAQFTYIQNDEDEYSGYTKLDGLLKQPTGPPKKGFVLDDFVIRCKEEVHYLVSLLAKYNLSLDLVVYLQADDISAAMQRAGAASLEPIKLAQHAAHYEASMEYFNNIKDMVVVPEDILNKTPEQLSEEVFEVVRKIVPGTRERVMLKENRLMNFANFVPEVSTFIQVKNEVKEHLGGKWHFLNQPGQPLDYGRFVRKNHALRGYKVSANFQGDRIMVVKRGSHVYLIPETQYGMFSLSQDLVPTSFQTSDDFIFDAIGVKLRGEENRIIFVNDVLHCADPECTPRSPLERRLAKVKELLSGMPKDSVFMGRPTFNINEIGTQLVHKEWKFPGDGLIFYPPGRYVPGIDQRVMTFDFPAEALVTVRVWDGKTEVMNHPTNPPVGKKNQPAEQGWTFAGFTVNLAGEEVMLEDSVQVSCTDAEKFCINDGCLLDFKRVPGPGKKPSYWKFYRRADHKASPSGYNQSYCIANPDWTKDQLTTACSTMKPLVSESKMAPPPPASPVN